MIQPSRIRALNDRDVEDDGAYVLYWMQASQRAMGNHALEYAVRRANDLGLPLCVCFVWTPDYPEANLRHYAFMAEGLEETAAALKARGIGWVVRCGNPPEEVLRLSAGAACTVTDRSYLAAPKSWRVDVAREISSPFIQVESDVVVPVDTASEKEEWSAATLRRKINRLLPDYLVPLKESGPEIPFDRNEPVLHESADITACLSDPAIDRSVPPSPLYRGGADEARRLLKVFLAEKLDHFGDLRNDPSLDYASHLSPYLHFGQISPLSVALAAIATGKDAVEPFLEQLIVRRELAVNFTEKNPAHATFAALPDWARTTLSEHRGDPRPYVYTPEELEAARTHDPYWNAAQEEMVVTGMMQGYMRMYWGKKILEWSATPDEAFATALVLNNRYELDGRDPNSYTGVAWCFGKHDRAWKEREIFGKVRYMNDAGLRRKFAIDAYVDRVEDLKRRYRAGVQDTKP
ncbi:deoxyribodipyrimidine photolyase [Methanomicrobiaceae archaeon CYW5]|uniref:deoxyribodipyrimidine photo-lyase n=1 Tax=Methanovulcanius yangii TaxID=1789227 RepID=UPI0029C9FD83|nr:deoxyribodipyrimidine photo-lyase [Methanovulcanius yangii]MBT8508118.1 deoxyribodipyrimidine photolyase [Methanovulcanius yangii]